MVGGIEEGEWLVVVVGVFFDIFLIGGNGGWNMDSVVL